ncbi:quino amine dehydrogenase beta chain [Trichoderma arundinaceum]|uniref:Quino amine dehydrogenase beta chain n=1 Tax=Trichoderma arundinaceum TaxID=490622 RepID=A0A395NJC3_TRIAR|nr:quino amine dehydrogenase beta chain [Trichoderma arundinaceum]
MYSSLIIAMPALLASVAAGAVIDPRIGSPWPTHLDSRVIYQFSNGTTLENIAVRSNGNLLVTLTDRPEIYEVNPFDPKDTKLIHHFSGYLGLLGITEVTPDVFTINVGNFSFETGPAPGSWAIWQLAYHKDQPKVSKITDIPEAAFLNGMTTLDSASNTILSGDSTAGVIYSVNTQSGKYKVVLDNEAFKVAPGAPLPIGLNGIQYLDNYVYYVNSFNPIFGRVRVDKSGSAVGSFNTIATGVPADDFAITKQAAYIAGNIYNVLTEVKQDGESEAIAGNLNSTLVAGATSAAFGRTRLDKHVLYVVTDGAKINPVNGTFTEGGKIVALKI